MRGRLRWTAAALAGCVIAVGAPACSERPLPPRAARDGGDAGDAGPSSFDAGVEPPSEVGAPPGVVDWGVPIGSQPSPAAAGSTSVRAVVPTDDGGAIVAGTFTGMVAFAADAIRDGTPGSGFVARYRSDQRLVWVHVLPADGGHVVVADMAALGDDEIAVAGWFDGTLAEHRDTAPIAVPSAGGQDAFVARLASDGSVRWIKRAGGAGDDIARGVAVGADLAGAASIAITGAIGDGAVFGPGEPGETRAPVSAGPIFAARLNGDGALAWARFAGGGVPGQGYGVAHDVSGAVAVTGWVNGVASFGSDVNGLPVSIDPALGRAFVARWDVMGRLLWVQQMGGPEGEGEAIAVQGTAVASTGLFYGQARFGSGPSAPMLTADTTRQAGAYLAAFAPGGAIVSARRLVGSGIHPWRLRAARDGSLLLAASFGGGILLDPDGPTPQLLFSSGATDALFARLGNDGALRWAIAGGGPGDDQAADFAAAPDGTTWAVGTYYGPATFGTGSAFGAGTAVRLDSGTDGSSFLLRLLLLP